MTSRIDIISQNAADGEYYLVEKVARHICKIYDVDPDFVISGTPMWQDYIKDAIAVIEIVRDFNKEINNAKD